MAAVVAAALWQATTVSTAVVGLVAVHVHLDVHPNPMEVHSVPPFHCTVTTAQACPGLAHVCTTVPSKRINKVSVHQSTKATFRNRTLVTVSIAVVALDAVHAPVTVLPSLMGAHSVLLSHYTVTIAQACLAHAPAHPTVP